MLSSSQFGFCCRDTWISRLVLSLLVLSLAACGGSEGGGTGGAAQASRVTPQNTSSETDAMAKSAALNARELESAAQSPVSKEISSRPKALGIATSPIFRFYNTISGAHFFTASEPERDRMLTDDGAAYFDYEGPAFSAALPSDVTSGLAPVHRFYNSRNGVHFYTISEEERAYIQSNPALQHYVYEGVAYLASKVEGGQFEPLYRFYVPGKGFHFYTASASERDRIQRTLTGTYVYEGVGYYVLKPQLAITNPALPHSGLGSNQCHDQQGLSFVACSTSGALALSAQQDGHRVAVNAMRFAQVRGRPTTECVRDEVTGLVWEGKTASGYFGGNESFTQLGNGELDDVYTYVQVANLIARCGFYDWRLPTRAELLTVVNYGSSVRFDPTWFPNQPLWGGAYRTAQAVSELSGYWWVVDSSGFSRSNGSMGIDRMPVRLVRGDPLVANRFTVSSDAYPGDAAGNVISDANTGMRWRRCVEGQVWTGTACVGTPALLDHGSSLALSSSLSGWRVPNVKELGSLIDLARPSGVLVNTSFFPSAPAAWYWSSTPHTDPGWALLVDFAHGDIQVVGRDIPLNVRLVRASP